MRGSRALAQWVQRDPPARASEMGMGDKSPKAKQREKNQKDAVKKQSKDQMDRRQAAFATTKEKKK